MGAGRTCCILSIPMLGTIATFVLCIFVMIGGTSTKAPVNDLYFLKVNTSKIDVSTVVPDLRGVDVSSTVNTVARQIGIPDYYTIGLWNYCEAESTNEDGGLKFTYCDKPKAMYWFNPVEMVTDSISRGPVNEKFTVVMPEEVQDYLNVLEASTKAMFIFYLIGTIFSFLTFVFGWFTFNSRWATCCVATLSLLTLLLLVAAGGLATGVYAVVGNAFNDNLGEFGIESSLNAKMYGIAWAAAAAAAIAFLGWIFAICCGSTKKDKATSDEKQPFIGYVPEPYQPHGHQSGHRV